MTNENNNQNSQSGSDAFGFSGLGGEKTFSQDSIEKNMPSLTNAYATAHESRNEPDLDVGAPELDTIVGRNVNKKAIAFLLGLGALALLGTVWAFNAFFSGSKEKEAPQEEIVKIPDAPVSNSVTPIVAVATNDQTATPEPPIAVVKTPSPPPMIAQTPMTSTQPMSSVQVGIPVDPYLEQRRQGGTMVNAVNDGGGTNAEGQTDRGSAVLIKDADNFLVKGTYIRCVLETKIVTDIPGFTSCVITEPVYSMNGKKLLLLKGSKVSGRYQQTEVDGPRLAVVWDRITTPNGYDVRLESPGVDNLGGSGHIGDYKSHWPSRIGSALLISLIADTFKYAAAEYGPTSTTTTSTATTQSPYDSTTAKTIETSANNAITRASRRPATVTINQGSLLNIYTARDIDFTSVLSR